MLKKLLISIALLIFPSVSQAGSLLDGIGYVAIGADYSVMLLFALGMYVKHNHQSYFPFKLLIIAFAIHCFAAKLYSDGYQVLDQSAPFPVNTIATILSGFLTFATIYALSTDFLASTPSRSSSNRSYEFSYDADTNPDAEFYLNERRRRHEALPGSFVEHLNSTSLDPADTLRVNQSGRKNRNPSVYRNESPKVADVPETTLKPPSKKRRIFLD